MYALAGLILLCFSVGFAELSRQLPKIDGLWSYVRAGLGRVPAGAAALLALFGYAAVLLGAVGATAYYFHTILSSQLGLNIGWFWYALALMVVVGLLAWRRIDLSARVVGVLVLAEMTVIALVDVILVARSGASAFPSSVLSWTSIASGSPGVGLMYAFISFLAFEAAALYAGEAKDPNRSVPRATLISVTVIAVSSCCARGSSPAASVSTSSSRPRTSRAARCSSA